MHRGSSAQSRPQNIPGLFFHRTSVVGSSDPQATLDVLVELSNGNGSHAINDIIDGTDCTIEMAGGRPALLASHAGQFLKKRRIRHACRIRADNLRLAFRSQRGYRERHRDAVIAERIEFCTM
jgi:hypothetical protein